MTVNQTAEERHEADRQYMEQVNQLIHDAAALSGRPVPFASEAWRDLHNRRHIAPLRNDPKQRRHEHHSPECWCVPTIHNEIIFHWEAPPTDTTHPA